MKTEIDSNGKAAEGMTPLLRVSSLVLGLSAILLVWVGVRTVQASHDTSVRTGLDYEAFLHAVDDLIAGAGDSALISFHEVKEPISSIRTVSFDTIAILADVEAFPAFDQAGFLYDQVRAFNRFQKDRLALGRVAPEWYDRLRAYNPSIFRVAPRPDGSKGLARAPAAWGLRVRSPLEGEWNGEIRAVDVVRDVGLLSPRISIPLRKPVSLLRPVEGRNQLCEFVPSAGDVRVYCLSEERIAQATLRLASDGAPSKLGRGRVDRPVGRRSPNRARRLGWDSGRGSPWSRSAGALDNRGPLGGNPLQQTMGQWPHAQARRAGAAHGPLLLPGERAGRIGRSSLSLGPHRPIGER